MSKTVRQLLERYLEKAGKAKEPAVEQAEVLGISAGHWSQLKNEKVKLTDDVIAKVATSLAANNVARKEDVILDLTRTRDAARSAKTVAASPGGIFDAVGGFFNHVSNSDSLVCVDYRDFPQAAKDGPYPTLGEAVASALVRGCCYAMFNSFGSAEEQQKKLIDALEHDRPPEGHMYLLRLANEVRKVFGEIKKTASEKAEGEEWVKGQIVLYEARQALSLPACGISSRMFYASYMEDARRRERAYQWIASTRDRDYFIERGKSSISLEAFALQFSPIPAFWSDKKSLPRTDAELEAAAKSYGFGEDLKWKVWDEPQKADDE